MSRFFVGQRVRVARGGASKPRKLAPDRARIGDTGTIVGTAGCPNAGFNSYGDYDVSLKLDRLSYCAMAPSHCLEPILPDGLESLAEINALYEPEPITESAPTQRIADEVSLALETIALTGRRV